MDRMDRYGSDRIAMAATTAGFYRRKNRKMVDDDIEVIKVEPNES